MGVKPENQNKKQSIFKRFFSSIVYKFKHTPALGFVGIMSIVCLVVMLLFLRSDNEFLDSENIKQMSTLFMVLFIIAIVLFLLLFIFSGKNSDNEQVIEENNEKQLQKEKKQSKLAIFLKNLNYKLSYTPALGFVGIMSIVCVVLMLFFLNNLKVFEENVTIKNSSLIFVIFFAISLLIFTTLFISSIILNLLRRKRGER